MATAVTPVFEYFATLSLTVVAPTQKAPAWQGIATRGP
jgi:hypothetical protein